jgi:hypothetical protein
VRTRFLTVAVLSQFGVSWLQAQAPGDRRVFAGWNVGYAVPAGWQVAQQTGRVHVLTQAGAGPQAGIFVAPGMYGTFNDAAVDLNKGFIALGLSGMPTGQPAPSTINGMSAMSVDYTGQTQMGVPLQARTVGMLTPHGTGLIVLGVAVPQAMAAVAAVVDQLAQSITVSGPAEPNTSAMAALRGRWMYYAGKADGSTSASGGSSRSYEEFVEFDGAGQFSYQSSSSVMVTTPGYTGSAGGAQSGSDAGTYLIVGSTLVLRGRQGQASFELQILPDRVIADGKTYIRN